MQCLGSVNIASIFWFAKADLDTFGLKMGVYNNSGLQKNIQGPHFYGKLWRGDKTPKAACPSSKRPGCGDDSGQSRGSSERRYDRCVEAMVISHWLIRPGM